MSSPVQDTADDASTCAEQQLVEMETLQSIYSQDELQFDTDCAPVSSHLVTHTFHL